MKFLNVYCENRKAEIFINLDKIIYLLALDEEFCQIELDGAKGEPVRVAMPAEDFIRQLNREDKNAVGFRMGR